MTPQRADRPRPILRTPIAAQQKKKYGKQVLMMQKPKIMTGEVKEALTQKHVDQQALHYAMKYALFQLRYMRVKLEVQLNHDLIKLNRNRKKPNISVAINQHLKD